jgi:hypothetical protein
MSTLEVVDRFNDAFDSGDADRSWLRLFKRKRSFAVRARQLGAQHV